MAVRVVVGNSTPTSPCGSDAGLILSAAAMVKERLIVAVPPRLSVTLTVMAALLTAAFGVPENTPLLNDSSPGTTGGVVDHVYGLAPPEAVSVVVWYATPTSPCGSDAGLMLTAATIVSDRLIDAVAPKESVTCTVIGALAAGALGVPENTPLLNDKPPGTVAGVVDHVNVPVPPVTPRVVVG